jgi:hypothetical protein
LVKTFEGVAMKAAGITAMVFALLIICMAVYDYFETVKFGMSSPDWERHDINAMIFGLGFLVAGIAFVSAPRQQ